MLRKLFLYIILGFLIFILLKLLLSLNKEDRPLVQVEKENQKIFEEKIFSDYFKEIKKTEKILTSMDLMLLLRLYKRTGNKDSLALAEEKVKLENKGDLALRALVLLEIFQLTQKKIYREKSTFLLKKFSLPIFQEETLYKRSLKAVVLAKAYQVLGDKFYLEKSQKKVAELISQVYSMKEYSAMIWALIELYQSDFNYKWYHLAKELQEKQIEIFWSEKTLGFGIKKSEALFDLKEPSSFSLTLLNLLRLGSLSYNKSYNQKVFSSFKNVASLVKKTPVKFPFLLQGVDYFLDNNKEIAIIGKLESKEVQHMKTLLQQPFNPNKVISCGLYHEQKNPLPLLRHKPLIQGKNGGAYVCEKKICKLPTLNYKEASSMSLLSKRYQLH